MKTAAAAALLLFAASADAAAHSNHCYDPPCGLHLCTGKNGVADMAAEWDKQVAANKGPANGNSTSLQPPNTGNATVKHEPAFCKITTGRRLAAHAAAHLRVYVAGTDGSAGDLHPMMEAHHIDYLQVLDATKKSHAPGSRRLAAHATAMFYGKTWKKDKIKSDHSNAGFDFTILKSDKVTHIEAVEHCNLHGLWWSKKVAIADIPACPKTMASAQDPSRRLAAHANKFVEIKNFDGEESKCPAAKKDKADASIRATVAGGVMVTAAAMVASLFI